LLHPRTFPTRRSSDLTAIAAFARPPASEKGSPVSLRDQLESFDVEFFLGHHLLQLLVLRFQLLQPNRLFALHAAVLLPPAVQRALAYLQRLQHRCQVLVNCFTHSETFGSLG